MATQRISSQLIQSSQRGLVQLGISQSSRKQRASKLFAAQSEVVTNLEKWLGENGAPNQPVAISPNEQGIDRTVARYPLQKGDTAISIPDKLCVTLSNIFKDDTLAELLTTNKLSELACLALYLMYEKKRGSESFFYWFIRELDRRRARGQQSVESPLLWSDDEVNTYLAGSPLVTQVTERKEQIRQEYNELDTVWFMAGSLFQEYPYEQPSSEFSFELFLQAFCAVQSCVTHIQNVPVSRRFALVPLGPPLVGYKSTSRAMLKYHEQQQSVVLQVDQDYNAGDPVYAWCGPQNNQKLLLNYGIIDSDNPFDKLQLRVTLTQSDPLYTEKRKRLSEMELTSQSTFDLKPSLPPLSFSNNGAHGSSNALPDTLLPFLRLAQCDNVEDVQKVSFSENAAPVSPQNEASVLGHLGNFLATALAAYDSHKAANYESDDEGLSEPRGTLQRKRVAGKLVKIEMDILERALEYVKGREHCPELVGGQVDEGNVGLKIL